MLILCHSVGHSLSHTVNFIITQTIHPTRKLLLQNIYPLVQFSSQSKPYLHCRVHSVTTSTMLGIQILVIMEMGRHLVTEPCSFYKRCSLWLNDFVRTQTIHLCDSHFRLFLLKFFLAGQVKIIRLPRFGEISTNFGLSGDPNFLLQIS